MKPRLYLDTSVFGGYYDDEFDEFTKPLFDRIQKNEFILLFSTITQDELENAPEQVKGLVKHLKSEFTEFIDTSAESIELATQYIAENVVGQTSYADCLHITLATINHADFLVSWNFKHIVNWDKIRLFNAINMKLGYPPIEIRSPKELLKYED